MRPKKLLHITATEPRSLKRVDLYYPSIHQARKSNPTLVKFEYVEMDKKINEVIK